MISTIEGFNALISVMRNDSVFDRTMSYMDQVEDATLNILGDTEKEWDRVAAVPLDNSSKAATAVAKILLMYLNASRLIMNTSHDMAAEVNHSCPQNFDAAKIIDMRPAYDVIESEYNGTEPLLESHMNGTIEGADAEFCDGIEALMHRITEMTKIIDHACKEWTQGLNDTQGMDQSPIVLTAPDIMPKLKRYSQLQSEKVLSLGSVIVNSTTRMVDVSLRLLNDNQQCDITRDSVESAAHLHSHLGLLALAAAVLASSRAGFGL